MSLATNSTPPDVSVLVPAKDEAENLSEFVRLTRDAMLPLPYAVELVIVNDGSHDGTQHLLEELSAKHPFVRIVTHRAQRGIADALRSGADVARGRVLVYYPADLQYLPADIPALVGPILEGQADVVTGTKQGQYNKRFVSGIYNALCRWLFGVRVNDLNSVKAYRREVMDAVPTRPDWHRFMVVIAASQGFRLAQQPVPLYPRRAGSSKFGIGRIPVGVLDLMSVWFQVRFGRKPMLFFGVAGALLFFFGLVVGLVALYLRFGPPHVGFRPLLDLIIVLVISGVALFGFGFVGEMLAGMREELRVLGREVERLNSKDDARLP
jgi:glycosyltransferase involved in cell wall biosynthesis